MDITPKQNWLASKLFSTHPADSFLRVVIRAREPLGYGVGYVVHTYNGEQSGYSNGDYCQTWEQALACFDKRGNRY